MGRVREFTEANYRYHSELEWYPGVVVDIQDDDFGYGPTVILVIELDDDPLDDNGNKRQLKAMASDSLTPNSKLTKWVKGILGDEAVGPGQAVDLDLLTAERIEVMFEYGQNSKKEPDEKVTQIRAEK
jgi:hypothetical protein